MDSKQFKVIFGEEAKKNNFEKNYGGWFKESSESLVVLDLQKSNFGNYFELNIKIFIQGIFGINYLKSKELVKKQPGDIFVRQPDNYRDILDFDFIMDDLTRFEGLKNLFKEFIIPFANMALSKSGIKELAYEKKIFLLPAVKEELMK